ncbi:MAG: hypothetical protein NTU44_04205 [Bacteroidetes bacterium]|nr:hypothetical protein [Bacteroidota bacterium]
MAHYYMIPRSIVILLIILNLAPCFGQTNQNCDCPKTIYTGTKADTIFYLSNGKSIVLCGYKNPESSPTNYSEFVLAVCGIDTIWKALSTCEVRIIKDTLLVVQLKNLPLGKNFQYQETPWKIEKIYFNKDDLQRKISINKQITFYNQRQIESVIVDFESLKPESDDNRMNLAYKLFIASISGDKKARSYFFDFPTKFGVLDGAYKEEYMDLTTMLQQWDRK